MATLTEKKLGANSVDTNETTIYTVPASTTAIVKIIWITNVTSADIEIDIWNPAVATTGVANKLCSSLTVPANDFVQISTYLPMPATSTIIAKMITGAASAATVLIYGAEIV